MAESRNIVVVGASYSGLGTAHYIAKHVLPQLQHQSTKYELHLVEPSTHFWWHVAAPRQIVDATQLKAFVPIMDGFEQYKRIGLSIRFHHGAATRLDTKQRSVTLKMHNGSSETIPYHALVLATGIRSPTPLTTLHGDYRTSQQALSEVNRRLAEARSVVVSGGGPAGVEIAGEIATHFKGRIHVTLLASTSRLLSIFNDARAEKIRKMLVKVGVTVVFNAKVSESESTSNNTTKVWTADGRIYSCDVYIPAHGVVPNTEWLSDDLKTNTGYVLANPETLRVDKAGERVYAAGDVAGVDDGGLMNMSNSLPVLGANIAHDLLSATKAGSVGEKTYSFKKEETCVVPVGPSTGVGAFNGWSIPSFLVSMLKGKNYMVGSIPDFTEGKRFEKA